METTSPNIEPRLVNLTGLSQVIGMPAHALRRAYHRGLIAGLKLGHRSLYFSPSHVLEQLTALAVKQAANGKRKSLTT